MSLNNKTELFFNSIPASSSETKRWDQEWIEYFNTEDPKPFLLDYRRLTKILLEIYKNCQTKKY